MLASRRGIIGSMLAFAVAPAIIRPGVLMPISGARLSPAGASETVGIGSGFDEFDPLVTTFLRTFVAHHRSKDDGSYMVTPYPNGIPQQLYIDVDIWADILKGRTDVAHRKVVEAAENLSDAVGFRNVYLVDWQMPPALVLVLHGGYFRTHDGVRVVCAYDINNDMVRTRFEVQVCTRPGIWTKKVGKSHTAEF